MSRTKPTDMELAELPFDCDRCGAEAHEWCVVVKAGEVRRFARWLHSARYWRVRHVVRLSGWDQWLIETDADLSAVRRAVRSLLIKVRAIPGHDVDRDTLIESLEAALAARGESA